MDALLHQIVSGLATGGIYGALALALVMIYRATHYINFVQGEMSMFSAFLAWALIQGGLPYWLAGLLTIAISFAGSAAIERLVIRRFKNAPYFTIVVVFIGLFVAFNSIAGWIWTYTTRSFPTMLPEGILPRSSYASSHEIGMIAVVVLLVVVLY